MNDKSEGIVLRQRDFKDNDYLLSVMMPEFGRVELVAKGAKKAQSKNGYACSPMTLADYVFDYRFSFTIHILHTTTVTDTFKHIRADLDKVAVANVMLDTVCYLTQESSEDHEFNQDIYALLKGCLQYLDQHDHRLLTLGLFMSNVLRLMGISPQVDGCCLCGSSKIVGISIADGGFVCEKCCKEQEKYSVQQLRRFRLLNKAEVQHLPILEAYEPYDLELVTIFYRYLSEFADLDLASWKFLCQLDTKH